MKTKKTRSKSRSRIFYEFSPQEESSSEELENSFRILKKELPPLEKSSVNDRTLWVWYAYWIEKCTIHEVAKSKEWCVPAVEWHLKRAQKVLRG